VWVRTGRWSELSAEQEVRTTEDERSFVIIVSSRVVVRVCGWGFRPKDQTAVPVGIITQKFPPSRGQPRVPVDMLGF
jgi:hypothetical protein